MTKPRESPRFKQNEICSKYGGLDVSEARRLKALEDENRKLKRLLAESMLDQAALKELLTKKW